MTLNVEWLLVGARRAGLSISKTADLLGFSHTTISRVYRECNLQQLRDAIMSIWTKISEECFQHLVESMP